VTTCKEFLIDLLLEVTQNNFILQYTADLSVGGDHWVGGAGWDSLCLLSSTPTAAAFSPNLTTFGCLPQAKVHTSLQLLRLGLTTQSRTVSSWFLDISLHAEICYVCPVTVTLSHAYVEFFNYHRYLPETLRHGAVWATVIVPSPIIECPCADRRWIYFGTATTIQIKDSCALQHPSLSVIHSYQSLTP
jgi:hypothetical protein